MERLVEWNCKEKNSALPKCINELGDVVDLEMICAHLATIYDIVGDISLDRLRELVEADRDGRCVVRKCKTGDTVYIVGGKKIVEAQIQEMCILESNGDIELLVFFDCDDDCKGCPFNSWHQSHDGEWSCDGEYGDGSIKQSDIGETVFLTREAAEAALEEE